MDGEAHSIHHCTQITAQSSFIEHDVAAEKKLMMIIGNYSGATTKPLGWSSLRNVLRPIRGATGIRTESEIL